MRDLPSEGKIYRHFKGTCYKVICVARDSETMEESVVYENLNEPEKKFVRPLAMFMSAVDREKYPDATQEYRFEEIKGGSGTAEIPVSESAEIPEDLMAFLDAETNEEKLDVLERIRTRLNDDIINAIALSLDTEIREGSISSRYEEIKDYLLTMIKYEGARLRK